MKHKGLCWVASPLRVLAMCGAVMTLPAGAAQVDVTWHYGGSNGGYSDANNWSPAVVPNNGENGNTYRATITSFRVSLDIDASVDALTLNGSASFIISGRNFSSAFTRNDASGFDLANDGIRVYGFDADSKAALGTLANFDASTGTLNSGIYLVDSYDGGPAAVLTFNDARIVTNSAELFLHRLGRITDQFGNDALRALAVNNGVLHLEQTTIHTAGDFTNNGELDLVTGGTTFATSMIIGGRLTNFNATTKTLSGGKYIVSRQYNDDKALLQFAAADIVTNAAEVALSGRPVIVDENGNDALQNFANNTAAGRIAFTDLMTTAHRVTNAGYIGIGNSFTLPAQGLFEQSGGELTLGGLLDTQGGSINLNAGFVTGGGTARGATFSNGVISPGGSYFQSVMTFAGDIRLGPISILRFDVAGAVRCPGVSSRSFPPPGYDAIDCTGSVTLDGRLQVNLTTANSPNPATATRFTPGLSDSFVLLKAQSPITRSFGNVANGQRLNTVDGGGSFIVSYGAQAADPTAVVLTAFQPNTGPATLLNISTRGTTVTGPGAMIGGFIITGSDPKPVLLRGLGPSLPTYVVGVVLGDPKLSLHDNKGATISSNDDWQQSPQRDEIEATGIAPTDARESAITATLQPGAYTGVLEGKDGATGTSLVEVYDLSAGAQSQLANISTRAYADADSNRLIGGMIVGGGSGSSRILVRALGPSLSKAGVTGAMDNPSVTLFDNNGIALANNDDWKQGGDEAAIQATGIPPSDDREAAIIYTLQPGSYTAVVTPAPTGAPYPDGNSGVALVEFYRLP